MDYLYYYDCCVLVVRICGYCWRLYVDHSVEKNVANFCDCDYFVVVNCVNYSVILAVWDMRVAAVILTEVGVNCFACGRVNVIDCVEMMRMVNYNDAFVWVVIVMELLYLVEI